MVEGFPEKLPEFEASHDSSGRVCETVIRGLSGKHFEGSGRMVVFQRPDVSKHQLRVPVGSHGTTAQRGAGRTATIHPYGAEAASRASSTD